jgi:hypothetical protein
MELSQLSIKCLANMPMLTGAMATAINELYNILGQSYYEEYYDLLGKTIISDKRTGFKLKGESTRDIITFGETPLLLEEIMSVYFKISFYQEIKTNPKRFSIEYGYLMDNDDTQNSLYFQLNEESETSFIEELIQSKDFLKLKSTLQEYQYGNYEDKKSIWIEFFPDETLSLEKINTCSELFKTTILMPILDELK